MKTLRARTQTELDKVLSENTDGNFHLDLSDFKTNEDLDLSGLKIKGYLSIEDIKIKSSIYLNNVEIKVDLYLFDAKIGGNLYLENANIEGVINLNNTEIEGEIKANYTQKDIDFLKSLPLDIIDLKTWQSGDNWLKAKTMNDLHTCGTTYCVRGYAEAQYYIKNGKEVRDKNTLYPNLKHLFHMTNEQFLKEREYIINL